MSRLTCFLAVFLVSLLSAVGSNPIVKRVGDEVVLVLKPAKQPSSITSILWRHNNNLAVEWEGTNTELFALFEGRSYLNNSTGDLTIKELTQKHSGEYTLEINAMLISGSITLKVIAPVPKPHISMACNAEKTQCTLTCEGNITGTDITWKFNNTEQKDSSKNLIITPDSTADNFICELKNPVSQESSEPIADPFPKNPVNNLNINKGLIVFVCLLVVVVAIGLVHRVKTGMWFYQKDSLPWQSDFWKRTDNQAPPEPEHANEEPAEKDAMIESGS